MGDEFANIPSDVLFSQYEELEQRMPEQCQATRTKCLAIRLNQIHPHLLIRLRTIASTNDAVTSSVAALTKRKTKIVR